MFASFSGSDGTKFMMNDTGISCVKFKSENRSLKGVSARVIDGTQRTSRVTATRIALLGIFALAFKKKKGGEKYLIIDGPDFEWTATVPYKKIDAAIKFASKVNNQSRQFNAGNSGVDSSEEADLLDSGVQSPENVSMSSTSIVEWIRSTSDKKLRAWNIFFIIMSVITGSMALFTLTTGDVLMICVTVLLFFCFLAITIFSELEAGKRKKNKSGKVSENGHSPSHDAEA